MIVAITLIAGGVWLFQDSLASVLFYLGKDGEQWRFNHLVRIFRACWGLIFIAIGLYLLNSGG